jgi:ABC-2 type transport system permease protein
MNFWRITTKDLLVLWRDRRSLIILLALPLVFITIIGLSTGQLLGWRNENEMLKIALVNDDKGELSRSIIERLKTHEGLDIVEVPDRDKADDLVEEGERTAVVEFGPEFQTRVDELTSMDALKMDQGKLSGDVAVLDVHVTAEETLSNAGAIIEVIVHGEVLRGVIPVVLRKNAWIRNYIRSHERAASAGGEPESETTAATGGPAEKALQSRESHASHIYQTIVPSYTVLFTFFLVTIMAGSFLAERDAGTLRRLKTMPVNSVALIIGKTLPFFFVSLIQGALLFLAGKLLFGMNWGPYPKWLPAVIICTSLSATSLGLLIATLVRTTGQVSAFATLIILTMAGISGCFMPRHWLPLAMQQISLGTPHAWALIAYNQLLNTNRPDFSEVIRCCLMLVAFSGGYLLLGWWRFRKTA